MDVILLHFIATGDDLVAAGSVVVSFVLKPAECLCGCLMKCRKATIRILTHFPGFLELSEPEHDWSCSLHADT